jgi:alpha-beta hydrolase superfamily lysophospholipase
MFSNVDLKTSDGKKIAGNYFDTTNPKGWIVYLHMMPATKESYTALAQKFQSEGFSGIAIDFRGHGDSQDGPDGYVNFNDSQHQSKINDVKAAVDFCLDRGTIPIKVSLVGSSIGANLALDYLVQNDSVNKAVLLSPGLDYRGITTKNLITKLTIGKSVFMIGSEDDNYVVECVNELYGLVPEGVTKEKIILKDAGHGTTMIERHPETMEEIINFVKK